MEPKRPFLRPIAMKCSPQTVSRFDGEEGGSHRCCEQLLSGSGRECHPLSLRTERELGRKVHEVIRDKNMDLLRCLIHCHDAPLEERNKQGLTPLYNALYSKWLQGTLLLLKHGADVSNAESIPQILCVSHEPLMHLAVQTGSEQLVRELIIRGASITVMDFDGEPCVCAHKYLSSEVWFQCLASSVTAEGSRRPDLLHDLFFVVSIAYWDPEKRQELVKFIRRQPDCYQSKMFEVLAAYLCFAGEGNNVSLLYWKMSAECTPCQLHDHTVAEEMGPRSVFADIMDVMEHPLPNAVTTDDDKVAICIRTLLAIEKYVPKDFLLVKAGLRLHRLLLDQGKIVSAFMVTSHLTTIRPLSCREASNVCILLGLALEDLDDSEELPLSVILDSMKTIQNCHSSLQVSCSEAQLIRNPHFERHLDTEFQNLFKVLLQTMKYFYGQKAQVTLEEIKDFTSHIKDFLQHFPGTFCRHAFHLLAKSESKSPSTASMIKNLVTYSAEVRGKVRQVNLPLHLLSDENGDTPLHCLARHRSHYDLVQEGVLQCFLDNGADLCTRNNSGETVRSILVGQGVYTESELLPSLQCLAAAAFMQDGRLRQSVQNCRSAAVRNFLLDH